MPLVVWADEAGAVPRQLHATATCDRCGRSLDLDRVDTDAWAAARRAGFSVTQERIVCAATCDDRSAATCHDSVHGQLELL